jgi:alpha-N-arabinofuranosidase
VLEADLRTRAPYRLIEHLVLESDDMKAHNTADDPHRITPRRREGARIRDGRLSAELAPLSWNVIRCQAA